jgi:peptidoglycan/LPS O-acetylase OafA/YrhL
MDVQSLFTPLGGAPAVALGRSEGGCTPSGEAAVCPALASGGGSLRVPLLDALRGLAALAVCWFHLASLIPLPDGLIRALGNQGYLGVHVFFVISGFVMPLSLARAGYSPRSFGRFILRRLVRLDPPYLASILLTVAFGYALAAFVRSHGGKLPVESAGQVLSHLAYATQLSGHSWLSPVYWTLAIEFQFYLVLGLLFPFLQHPRPAVRRLVLGAFALAPWLGAEPGATVFWYLPWFAFGIAACHLRQGLVSRWEFSLTVLALGVSLATRIETRELLALTTTALLSAFWQGGVSAGLHWLGSISYSLYLTHCVSGGAVLVVAKALHPPAWMHLPAVAVAVVVSVLAAAIFHRLVEQPAQQLAARIPARAPEPSGGRSRSYGTDGHPGGMFPSLQRWWGSLGKGPGVRVGSAGQFPGRGVQALSPLKPIPGTIPPIP